MKKNYLGLAFCIGLSLFGSMSMVSASVDKQLIELDAEEQARLEQERIAEQEARDKEAKRLAEEKRIADLAKQEEANRIAKATSIREKLINELDAELKASLKDTKSTNTKHGFFWKLWRGLTYPVRLVAKVFV